MDPSSQRPKGRDSVLSSLNVAIDAINLAKDIVDIAPAKAAFGSVSALLTMIRVHFFLFCDDGFLDSHASRTRWRTNGITSSSG